MHHVYSDEAMLKRLQGPPGIASFAALKHFKRLVKEREKELILSAARAGWRWYDIAILLGTSRQAVHQRLKRLMKDDEPLDLV